MEDDAALLFWEQANGNFEVALGMLSEYSESIALQPKQGDLTQHISHRDLSGTLDALLVAVQNGENEGSRLERARSWLEELGKVWVYNILGLSLLPREDYPAEIPEHIQNRLFEEVSKKPSGIERSDEGRSMQGLKSSPITIPHNADVVYVHTVRNGRVVDTNRDNRDILAANAAEARMERARKRLKGGKK